MTKRELLYQKINRKRDLSYRYYKRLSSKEQSLYTKSKLPPRIGLLALKHRVIVRCTLERSIKWALRNYKKYDSYLVNTDHYRKSTEKPRYALKELLFQGWVPIDNFPVDDTKYIYLITPCPLLGTKYIYPRRYRANGKGFKNPHHTQVGLAGYTKILYIKRWRQ